MGEALLLRRMKPVGDANDLEPDEADDLLAPKFTQTTHGVIVGDVVRRSTAANHAKAQADSIANVGVGNGICVDQPDANTLSIRYGPHAVTIATHGLGAFGTKLYLSQGSAGVLTATEPTSGIVFYLGFVIDTNTIMWEPAVPVLT